MGLYLGGQPLKGAYLGNSPLKAVYVGTDKIWPEWDLIDDFNRSYLGTPWTVGTGLGIVDSSFLRVTQSGAGRWTMGTTNDVLPSDNWRVEMDIANTPDAAQESGFLVGGGEKDAVSLMFSPNTFYVSRWTNTYSSTELVSYNNAGVTTGATVWMQRIGATITAGVNGNTRVTATLATNLVTGAGKRKIFLRQNLFRGGFLNSSYYYSPGIDTIRAKGL